MAIQKELTNVKSLSFLRPIFKVLRNTGDSILIKCLYSRMAGHCEMVLVDNESELKALIRRLPPSTILQWKILPWSSFLDCPNGIMPTVDGKLEPGAY